MQSLVYKLFSYLVPASLMINVRTADILCVVVVSSDFYYIWRAGISSGGRAELVQYRWEELSVR